MNNANNYPQLRYEGNTVYVPYNLWNSIPKDLIQDWRKRKLTIQLEIV